MAAPRRQDTGLQRNSPGTLSGLGSGSTMSAINTYNASLHRSVNVQKITNLNAQVNDAQGGGSNSGRNLALAQLWAQCASSVSYNSSVAAAAIVDLVSAHTLDWGDAFDGFENALSTAQGQALANIIHSLSNLIIAAAEASCGKSKTNTRINKNAFAMKNNRHPYIGLISTKAHVETILFAEMDRILNHGSDSAEYRTATFDILVPFLDFCLLDREARTAAVSSTALLWISKTLNSCLLDSELDPFVIHLFNYLCSVPDRFPLERSQLSTALQATISTLVDFYCLPSTQLSLSAPYKEVLGGRLLLTLLSWTADMRRFGLPTLQLVQSIPALFRKRKAYTVPTLPFETLWPLLSFLLMNSPTLDEQRIVVDWMHTTIAATTETVEPMIANVAFLPIFQVLGESQSEALTKKCSEILSTLEGISSASDTHTRSNPQPLSTSGVAAMIQAEISHLRLVWSDTDEEQNDLFFTIGDDSVLSSLIYTTFMFHPDENRRIHAATRLAQVDDGRLVALVIFIYKLRVDPSPLVKLHLLQDAIPSLVTSKDEIVAAKVLRTILTLINGVPNAPSGSKFVNSHMGAVGVRVLFLIWKRQPRVWKTLRHVIHGWVENRPRLLKTPVKGQPEYEMEVAVLTTIRDICAFDAAGYAEVLIPFLANLLGSAELYASSICTIIETMNLIVDANVVEPRAAWNVLLCHVAEHAMKTGHPGMLREMCVFYGIVGSRSEDTQVYLDLREATLVNYIQPLLDSEDPKILSAALKALSCFTAPEIMPILPTESPSLYIRKRIMEAPDSMVVDEYSYILDKLVRHELQHMRRGLFKDAAFKKTTLDALSGKQELDRLQGVLSVVSGNILQKWQSGDVNPGLRIGYALSSLLCSSVTEKLPAANLSGSASSNGPAEGDDSVQAIRAKQSYRNVMTALTDVTLTDHLVERISALEGWTALFDNVWVPNDDAQTLAIAETLVGDLYKKITDGYVPAHCANALFAITAKHLLQNFVRTEALSDVGGSDEVQFAVLVSFSFITPLAAVDEKLVTSVLGVFTDRLQDDAANANTSNELSSWATFATGWAFCNLLAGLVDSPTKTAELNQICRQTLQQLLMVFESNAASFALILGTLIAFPRLSVAIVSSSSQMRKSGSVSEDVEAIHKIKAMARSDLEAFLDNQQQPYTAQTLARLLGAPWVVAFSDRTERSADERKSDTELLDRALLAATSRRDLQPQLVHFTVPFCHMIHTNLDTRNPTSSEISLFTGRIHSLVNLIRITPTSAARHTAVVALASLFGIDWSQGPTVTTVGSHGLFSYLTSSVNPAAMSTVTNSALSTLMDMSGLSISITTTTPTAGDSASRETASSAAVVVPGSKMSSVKSTLMAQDLKAGRLAAMVLGHIACHMHRLGQADTGMAIGTSSEPKDYSRLPFSTSWLRALWDGLWEPLQMGTVQRAQKSYAAALELLLYTILSLPTPLPAVNWFPLLTQLVVLEPRLIVAAIQVASRHASTSTSLMEFLIMSLSNFKIRGADTPFDSGDDGLSAEELFVGEEGLGRILTLGGLPLIAVGGDQALAELDKVRGLDTLAKKVTLPISRVVDLVEKLVRVLFFNPDGSEKTDEEHVGVQVLQLVFLDTLSNHMRYYYQGRASSASHSARTKSNQSPVLSDDAKELLGELRSVILRIFYQLSFHEFLPAQRVLRRLADLSLMSLSHLHAARLDVSDVSGEQTDAGAQVLKEAIGMASLYRAGYLTSQQEGRLTMVAQSALLIVSGHSSAESSGSSDRQLAESAISVLLYAMDVGVGKRMSATTVSQRKRRDAHRLMWLQRILDLLVLMSSQSEVFATGLVLLLGGAVLMWWDEQDVVMLRRQHGSSYQDSASTRSGPAQDDAEVNLLTMVEDHNLEHGNGFQGDDNISSGSGTTSVDYNILEDDEFESWHQEFLQSISINTVGKERLSEHQRAVEGRLSLALPDIVMCARDKGSLSSGENQTASRLLRLALDSQIGATERQFLTTLLRRMEELVPRGQSWVLK
ncbi:hypothetical protein BGZ54_008343 [Gamsiella multidivaricata]|nr:hypothetical protein BGZ54_008343 [Gamsiella multidivaricata]